ncbi:hypothetical protein [Marispirochaeta sp.]|nr:hypothetical protein [Marispirochaeta sp.]
MPSGRGAGYDRLKRKHHRERYSGCVGGTGVAGPSMVVSRLECPM